MTETADVSALEAARDRRFRTLEVALERVKRADRQRRIDARPRDRARNEHPRRRGTEAIGAVLHAGELQVDGRIHGGRGPGDAGTCIQRSARANVGEAGEPRWVREVDAERRLGGSRRAHEVNVVRGSDARTGVGHARVAVAVTREPAKRQGAARFEARQRRGGHTRVRERNVVVPAPGITLAAMVRAASTSIRVAGAVGDTAEASRRLPSSVSVARNAFVPRNVPFACTSPASPPASRVKPRSSVAPFALAATASVPRSARFRGEAAQGSLVDGGHEHAGIELVAVSDALASRACVGNGSGERAACAEVATAHRDAQRSTDISAGIQRVRLEAGGDAGALELDVKARAVEAQLRLRGCHIPRR